MFNFIKDVLYWTWLFIRIGVIYVGFILYIITIFPLAFLMGFIDGITKEKYSDKINKSMEYYTDGFVKIVDFVI